MIDPTNKSQPKNKIPYYAIIDIYRFSFFLLFFLNTNQSLRPRSHGQRRQVINNNGNELIFAGRRQFFFLDFLSWFIQQFPQQSVQLMNIPK